MTELNRMVPIDPRDGNAQLRHHFPAAVQIWHVRIRAGSGSLTAYNIRGAVVIIHQYEDDCGWTAYIDPHHRTVHQTIAAIRRHVVDDRAEVD
jgi:hypothetical protein